MVYATSNPPVLVSQPIAGVRYWYYASTDDAATVDADGYFTNGWALGMRAGDWILVRDTDSTHNQITSHVVKSASKTGGVDLSDGVSVGGAADGD